MEEVKKQGMESLFVPYKIALALKKLGFDEPCFGCYDDKAVFGLTVMSIKQYYTNSKEDTWNCATPLYQQAFRWFREKYQLFSWVKVEYEYGGTSYGLYITGVRQSDIAYGPFTTYEEAELACLNKLIEIAKEK